MIRKQNDFNFPLRRCAAVLLTPAIVGFLGLGACSTHKPTASISTKSAERGRDLIIVNAKIWTGVGDLRRPGDAAEPTAMLIRNGRIAAVGSDLRVYSAAKGAARVIDAKGRRVIPGMTDSHTHIVSGGFQLDRLQLRDVKSREKFVRAVAREAATKKSGEWVLGGRWSVESWTDPSPPNKRWIDAVTGSVPLFLARMDGHQALVNSAALKLAGITAQGPADPKGGEIERDPKTGEPTGILKESAMGLVSRVITAGAPVEHYERSVSAADSRYAALRRAMKHANSLGLTSVHDMCSFDDLEVFRRAEADGALTLRITAYLSVDDWAAYADKLRAFRLNSDMVRVAGFKGYMDGSLGSRTAYMRDPYNDTTPDTQHPRGYLNAMADPPEKFRQSIAMADGRYYQLAVHAIGDEANHLLLNAYEYARQRNGRRGARHRIEHAQHLRVGDIRRFAKLGVVASMQPFHKADDGRYAEKAIGAERLPGSYAFRQLVDSGAIVIFGSDWPVVTLNPFSGMDSAVNAKTLAGDVWLESHSLRVEEALRSYTVMPPRAIHREDNLGTIEVGKLGDVVILSDDPLTMPKERVGEVKVVMTIVGGRIVYDSTR